MGPRQFSRVGDILPSLLRSIGIDKKLRERKILSVWASVVGDEIAARTKAVNIDKGVLYIEVEHGAWMQELHFMERKLIHKLKAEVPDVKLHKIRFGTGSSDPTR